MSKTLSASKAGFPCFRNVWYTVHISDDGETEKTVDTKTQRIFDVGTCLEPLIVEWLRQDGWDVEYNPGSQNAALSVEIPVAGGKLVGHPDCIISKGDIKNALVDIKTMNDRAFTYWKRDGTEKTKPQYMTQLHIYAMGLMASGRKIEKLGIVGVNKNNSDMHIEFFDFDPYRGSGIKDYAEMVFLQKKAPEIGCPAESWACSYCEFSSICELYKKPEPTLEDDETLVVTKDEAVIDAMWELKHARQLTKEAKELEKQAKKTLDDNVKAKGLSGITGGGLVFRMREKVSTNFDTEAFKAAHPEMVSEFTKSSVSLVYEIKECET